MKLRITKKALKTAGPFMDHQRCLLCTQFKLNGAKDVVATGYGVTVDGRKYVLDRCNAAKVSSVYCNHVNALIKPSPNCKPFTIELTPV